MHKSVVQLLVWTHTKSMRLDQRIFLFWLKGSHLKNLMLLYPQTKQVFLKILGSSNIPMKNKRWDWNPASTILPLSKTWLPLEHASNHQVLYLLFLIWESIHFLRPSQPQCTHKHNAWTVGVKMILQKICEKRLNF